MSKMLRLTMLALAMFPLYASCQPPTKAEGPAVYVAGGVQKPGRYDWFKDMTLLDAIKAAGGLSDPSVSTTNVTITHADHTKLIYPLSPGADAAKKPPLLQAGDTVYVPKQFKISPTTPNPSKPAN